MDKYRLYDYVLEFINEKQHKIYLQPEMMNLLDAFIECNDKIRDHEKKKDIHKELLKYINNTCDTCHTYIHVHKLCISHCVMNLCLHCFDEFVITYFDFIDSNKYLFIKESVYKEKNKITCLSNDQLHDISYFFK